MRQVPREAAKAVGNGWEDPRVLFRNETQWSKLKRTALSSVCYAHVNGRVTLAQQLPAQ